MLLAACGGGAAAPSKAEFVDQADSICLHARERLSEGLDDDPGSRVGRAGRPDRLYKGTADALRFEADEISALEAPRADMDEVDKIVESARRVAIALEEGENSLDGKDEAAAQMAKAEQLAEAYGLESCLLT
jgi:hypothetical protein